MEECGGRVLVGRGGRAERDVAEVPEGVGEGLVARVAPFPEAVALGELLGGESGEAEEV